MTPENWIGLLNNEQLDFVLGFSSGNNWDGQVDFSLPFRKIDNGTVAVAVKKGNEGLIMWLDDVISRRFGITL